MLLQQAPEKIKSKTLICKVDNLVVKDVIERKGTSANFILTNVGKEIFWIQQAGDFHMLLSYVSSQENKADEFTRQHSSLETTINRKVFLTLWEKWGPFSWDLMASAANVQKTPQEERLLYFSRYYDPSTSGVDVFMQKVVHLQQVYCFPPIPIIGKVLQFLYQNKLNCVIVLPAINAPWVNLASAFVQDVLHLSNPYDSLTFK